MVRLPWLRGWILRPESNRVLALGPTAPAVAQVPPFAVAAAVAVLEHRDRHPAEWFDARGLRAPPVVAAALALVVVPAAPGGVHQDADVIAFCLPARPESRRCYLSPHLFLDGPQLHL